MKIIRDITLGYTEGTSDKVYNIKLFENETIATPNRFYVACLYGRRGKGLKEVVKASGVSLVTANAEFDKVFNEKWKKGYRSEDAPAPDYARPVSSPGIVPPVYRPVGVAEATPTPVVCKTDSLTCSEDARSKALARLRAASA